MPIQVLSSERTFLNETQLPVIYMRKIVQCIFAFVRFAAIPDTIQMTKILAAMLDDRNVVNGHPTWRL